MNYKTMNYLFGPITSRRLGSSLGINLTTHKTCSLDCVYCEAGATTNLTTERKPYFSAEAVISELNNYFHISTPNTPPSTLNYITFSGRGEPTLNSEIGKVIKYIKDNLSQYKLALITNSTTLYDEALQDEILACDLIMPSLDAVSPEVFEKINRPHKDICIDKIVDSLIAFRGKFKNTFWLEIFFLEGINDTPTELALLKEACQKINPDTIQINSLDRQGLWEWVKKVSPQRLKEIKTFFEPLPAVVVT